MQRVAMTRTSGHPDPKARKDHPAPKGPKARKVHRDRSPFSTEA